MRPEQNYTIYHKNFAPIELLAKHPTPAIYNNVYYLFCESLEYVSGIIPDELVDISLQGLKDDDDDTDDGQLKKHELDTMIDGLMQSAPRGREIRLSVAQGKHLEKRFKIEEDII
jgi:hypothetical protein